MKIKKIVYTVLKPTRVLKPIQLFPRVTVKKLRPIEIPRNHGHSDQQS